MMKKMKVYLDTSVISYLLQEDSPGKMAETQRLWKLFEQNRFDIYLSTVTLEEVNGCPEPKRSKLWDYMEQITYTTLGISYEALEVAGQLIEMKILTEKSFDDCQHIGAAVVNGCDCIVSWNFKHIVNMKTINGLRKATYLRGYKAIEIWNPSMLLEWRDNGGKTYFESKFYHR